MEDPWTDLDVNCRGNLVLLEALRARNPRREAGRSSARGCSTGKPATAAGRPRSDLAEPLCLHAIHKHTVEQYLQLYGGCSALRYAVARVTNPYGPGQPSGRTAYGVVNRLIHLALADEPLTVYGDGAQQRDYVHVDDVGRGAAAAGCDAATATAASTTSAAASARRMIDAGAARSSTSPAADRIEHVEWPALARADRDRRLRRRHLAHRARARLAAGDAARDGLRADRGALPRARRLVSAARIRVVYLAHAFMVGGAEEMVLNLVRQLPARFEPMVCCIHSAGPIGEEIRRTGVPFTVLGLTPGLRRPFDVLGIRDFLRDTRPHIVHTFLLTASLYGRLAAMLARVPIVIGTEVNIYENKRRRTCAGRALLMARHRRASSSRPNRCATSTSSRCTPHPAKVDVIYNAVDWSQLRRDDDARRGSRDRVGVPARRAASPASSRGSPSRRRIAYLFEALATTPALVDAAPARRRRRRAARATLDSSVGGARSGAARAFSRRAPRPRQPPRRRSTSS